VPATNAKKVEQRSRVLASPLAKRLARQSGIAITGVRGTGPHGRILSSDVQAVAESDPRISDAPDPVMERPDDRARSLFPDGSYSEVPHDAMRRTIARRLSQAKSTVPHFYLTADCRIDDLLDLRQKLNSVAPINKDGLPAYRISVNDLVVKAYALALRAVPDANVSWTEEAMLRHNSADIGVAVSISGGLITPIVRSASEKSLVVLSNEIRSLVELARIKKLKPEQYQGGTATVSNLGMLGAKTFAAIVNPPQATILAVGEGIRQPVVVEDKFEVATVMTLTLSTDHRIVDGALAAELMRKTKSNLENPVTMCL
jgi:pyruvate dehydrogenase E2 component (dihydrolipoamide acetyltransferase)